VIAYALREYFLYRVKYGNLAMLREGDVPPAAAPAHAMAPAIPRAAAPVAEYLHPSPASVNRHAQEWQQSMEIAQTQPIAWPG
jgi:hypothetical protein